MTQAATASSGTQAPVVLIGFGAGGVNAAIGLRTGGYEGPITVLSNTSTLPYSPILTSYYAGGMKTYEECFPWGADDIADLNLDIVQGSTVTELDPAAHIVRTADAAYPYSKCVIATGATPMAYGFPGVEGEDYKPYMLRTLDDAERLKAMLEDPTRERILLSGASMVALKTLEACLNKGKVCTLVGMNPHVLDFNAFPETAIRFEKGMRAKGVTLRLGQTIKSVRRVESDGASHLEVTFSTGDVDVFDEISVSHGMKSNLDFILPDTIEVDRAIVVDEFCRTSDPDVYAAGDVAQGTELISGQKRIVGIWKNAARQGACAGRAIAAELAGREPSAEDALEGAIATNTIGLLGTLFISAGTMEVTDDRWTEVDERDDMTIVCVYEKTDADPRRLVGFNITCDEDVEGSRAYDLGAMLTLRIEAGCKR